MAGITPIVMPKWGLSMKEGTVVAWLVDEGTDISVGMPILDVDKARMVVVVKRSMSPGFAGIPNPLFANENSLMYFADAQAGILEVVRELKAI